MSSFREIVKEAATCGHAQLALIQSVSTMNKADDLTDLTYLETESQHGYFPTRPVAAVAPVGSRRGPNWCTGHRLAPGW